MLSDYINPPPPSEDFFCKGFKCYFILPEPSAEEFSDIDISELHPSLFISPPPSEDEKENNIVQYPAPIIKTQNVPQENLEFTEIHKEKNYSHKKNDMPSRYRIIESPSRHRSSDDSETGRKERHRKSKKSHHEHSKKARKVAFDSSTSRYKSSDDSEERRCKSKNSRHEHQREKRCSYFSDSSDVSIKRYKSSDDSETKERRSCKIKNYHKRDKKTKSSEDYPSPYTSAEFIEHISYPRDTDIEEHLNFEELSIVHGISEMRKLSEPSKGPSEQILESQKNEKVGMQLEHDCQSDEGVLALNIGSEKYDPQKIIKSDILDLEQFPGIENRSSKKSDGKLIKNEQFLDNKGDNDYIRTLKAYQKSQKNRKEDPFGFNDDASNQYISPKQKIKSDPNDGYYGSGKYYCEVCQIIVTCKITFNSHINGKKHKKAIKSQNKPKKAKARLKSTLQAQTIKSQNKPKKAKAGLKSTLQAQELCKDSRFAGNKRQELPHEQSSIQEVVDHMDTDPLPGLHHVVEIRNGCERTFSCELCSAACQPSSIFSHLMGYKHYLKCLKEIDPEYYESIKDHDKRDVFYMVRRILFDHQQKYGRGLIRVAEKVPVSGAFVPHAEPGPSSKLDGIPKSKYRDLDHPKEENYKMHIRSEMDENDANLRPIPGKEYLNTSKGDFYCTLCDAHMNNMNVWKAHIIGKRHAKNVKKDSEPKGLSSRSVKAPYHVPSTLEAKVAKIPNEIIVD